MDKFTVSWMYDHNPHATERLVSIKFLAITYCNSIASWVDGCCSWLLSMFIWSGRLYTQDRLQGNKITINNHPCMSIILLLYYSSALHTYTSIPYTTTIITMCECESWLIREKEPLAMAITVTFFERIPANKQVICIMLNLGIGHWNHSFINVLMRQFSSSARWLP